MRTLKFIVTGQQIKKDPSCDFSGLVAGTKGYLRAEFSFSSEWNCCRKAAAFWIMGEEHPAILKENACIIPAEALTWSSFEVSVLGMRKDYKIATGKVKVTQERRKL